MIFIMFWQVLVDDSARLQALYPGSNAEHIAEQQALVIDNWNTLQERASRRKEELHAASDLHKFLAEVEMLMLPPILFSLCELSKICIYLHDSLKN